MSGGSQKQKTTSILGREREIDELNAIIKDKNKEIIRINDIVENFEKECLSFEEKVKDTDTKLHGLDIKFAHDIEKLNKLKAVVGTDYLVRKLNAEERVLGRYHIGEGITGLVAKNGKAEIVLDVRKDPRFLNRTHLRKVDAPLSFVCVPLIHRGQVIGTLSVDREMSGDTGSLVRDVALLEIIANLCAEAASVFREECEEQAALKAENARLRDIIVENPGRIVGNSPDMKVVYEQIRHVAPSEATVLIRGASGTGKELYAQAIHNGSNRRNEVFVAINCANFNSNILESELFGYEEGAFTGAKKGGKK